MRRNVSRTWFVAGGIVATMALGGIVYAIARTVHGRPKGKKPLGPAAVGDTGYVWPHRDLFLDESGFGEALENFGYDVGDWSAPGWTVTSSLIVSAVREFQADYNSVRPTLEEPPTEALATSGRIDDATVNAMVFVHELQQAGHTWPLVVLQAKETVS